MSVCKMFLLNLIEICWLAPGRILASSEKTGFCQCHLTLLRLFGGNTKLLNFDWLSIFALLILVH